MRGRAACAVMVAMASACEFSLPLELHPDVAAIQVLLVAGEDEARMLVVYPHRDRIDGAPEVTATIEGPGGESRFYHELAVEACDERAVVWPFPTRCRGAALPEAIEPGGAYRLHGTAPLGKFTGETSVPTTPAWVEPTDSLRVSSVYIPVRYGIGSDIGTLLAEPLDVFVLLRDGTKVEIPASSLGSFPQILEGDEADTVKVVRHSVRFSLRLAGIGQHFTNFIEHTGTNPRLQPWPSFGIEGEGVYGYFDGVTRSAAVRIHVLP